MIVEAAGFGAATPEASTEAGIDDELQFSVIELELQVFVLFTEVSESI